MTSTLKITMIHLEPLTLLTFFSHKTGQGPDSLLYDYGYPEASQTLRKGFVSLPPEFQNLFSLVLPTSDSLRTVSNVSRPMILFKNKLYPWTLRKQHKPHNGDLKAVHNLFNISSLPLTRNQHLGAPGWLILLCV